MYKMLRGVSRHDLVFRCMWTTYPCGQAICRSRRRSVSHVKYIDMSRPHGQYSVDRIHILFIKVSH